jgi:hypothetical protein
MDIMNQNENVKKTLLQADRHAERDSRLAAGLASGPPEHQGPELQTADFSSCFQQAKEGANIFINLTEGERIMIEGWSYLEQKLNEDIEIS